MHHPVTGLVSLVCLALGFILNYFGIRLFRLLIFITGFLTFSVFGYVALINLHVHYHNFGTNFSTILACGILGFGVLGAAVSGFLWKWFLMGVGAFGGLNLGLLLFIFIDQAFSSPILTFIRPFVLAAYAIAGAILIKRYERPIIICATSVTGALLLTFGIDIFISTGFDALIMAFLSGADLNAEAILITSSRKIIGMCVFWIGSSLLGIFIQSRLVGRGIDSHTRK